MLMVQVAYKNNADANWNEIAYYKTRRGAEGFIAKNRLYYPEDIFNIRIVGEEEIKNKPQDFRDKVKIGDVFVGSWGYDATFYEAYVVVGFTPSGKSLKVKKLCKTDASDEISGYGPCAWGIKFVKPSDEYMQNDENVKTVRALDGYRDICFKAGTSQTMFLVEGFNYSRVYVEDDYR